MNACELAQTFFDAILRVYFGWVIELIVDQTLGLLKEVDSRTLGEGNGEITGCEHNTHQKNTPTDRHVGRWDFLEHDGIQAWKLTASEARGQRRTMDMVLVR